MVDVCHRAYVYATMCQVTVEGGGDGSRCGNAGENTSTSRLNGNAKCWRHFGGKPVFVRDRTIRFGAVCGEPPFPAWCTQRVAVDHTRVARCYKSVSIIESGTGISQLISVHLR